MVVCHVPLDWGLRFAGMRHWGAILEVELSARREGAAVIVAVQVASLTIRDLALGSSEDVIVSL